MIVKSVEKVLYKQVTVKYPVMIWCCSTIWPDPEPDSKKWLDIRPTGTGYQVHPYLKRSENIKIICRGLARAPQ